MTEEVLTNGRQTTMAETTPNTGDDRLFTSKSADGVVAIIFLVLRNSYMEDDQCLQKSNSNGTKGDVGVIRIFSDWK